MSSSSWKEKTDLALAIFRPRGLFVLALLLGLPATVAVAAARTGAAAAADKDTGLTVLDPRALALALALALGGVAKDVEGLDRLGLWLGLPMLLLDLCVLTMGLLIDLLAWAVDADAEDRVGEPALLPTETSPGMTETRLPVGIAVADLSATWTNFSMALHHSSCCDPWSKQSFHFSSPAGEIWIVCWPACSGAPSNFRSR